MSITTTSYLETVSSYADNVTRWARDVWGERKTPLLADGVHVKTHEPTPWLWGGKDRIPCNFANQQHLLRVLVGLSTLSEDERWQKDAEEITAYALAHLQHESGLLHWGGHVAWDLIHDEPFGHAIESPHHELKCSYPFYELMWKANPQATQKFVEGLWDAHIRNWSNLDISRHGVYQVKTRQVPIWQDEFEDGPVFFVGEGLSFVNAGSDLFFAAAMLHSFNGEDGPLKWAKHLAKRYHDTANERTGLVGYQFSQIERDRAQKQLGPEFGEKALEGKTLMQSRTTTRYAAVGVIQFQIAEQLGSEGDIFREWAHSALTALATHTYDFENNLLLPMFTDGTPIRPQDVKRPGYYKPEEFAPWKPNSMFFRAYATAYRITRDPLMWRMVSRIARGHDLGDWGMNPDNITASNAVNSSTRSTLPADIDLLYGMLELWRATGHNQFCDIAVAMADRLAAQHYREGMFLPHPQQNYARIDSRIPLALLHVAAAVKHGPEQTLIPADRGGRADFTSEHDTDPWAAKDRWKRVSDNRVLYAPVQEAVAVV